MLKKEGQRKEKKRKKKERKKDADGMQNFQAIQIDKVKHLGLAGQMYCPY